MEQETSQSLFGLKVDYESGSYFRETTKWARFIAIVSLVAVVVVLAFFLLANNDRLASEFSRAYEENQTASLPGTLGSVQQILKQISGVLFGISVPVMVVLLFLFAKYTRRGIDAAEKESFNTGLKYLKYFFIVSGVAALMGLLSTFFETIVLFLL